MKLGFRQICLLASVILMATSSLACYNEALERQAEQIRQQEMEIARQRKELEALAAGQQVQDQRQRVCVRAFREYFDKAQLSTTRDEAISLYRHRIAICPDDPVAHYQLGRAHAASRRQAQADKAL